MFIVLSAKTAFLSPPQKTKEHYCEHNCANWFLFVRFFFCIFAFGGFCCVRFLQVLLRGMKNTKKNNKNKQQERKQDHNMQIRKPLSHVTKKDNTETTLYNLIV